MKEIIKVLSSYEATRRKMKKYYPACRCGVHGDTKYNRKKFKKETQRIVNED